MKNKFDLTMIKQLRDEYQLLQFDICRFLRVSDVSYRLWELRVRKPSDINLENLKNLFEVLDIHKIEISSREDALNFLEKEFVLIDNGKK